MLPVPTIKATTSTMISGAGGAESRRRRGTQSHCSSFITHLFLWLIFSVTPTFSHLQLILPPHLAVTACLIGAQGLPLNRRPQQPPPLEPEINLSHVPSNLAALADHRSHRISQTILHVTMMNPAAEGSTLTHKQSSIPNPLALLSSCLINISPSLSRLLSPSRWPPQTLSTIKEARGKTLMCLMDSPLSPLYRSPIRLMSSSFFKTRGPFLSAIWSRWITITLMEKSRRQFSRKMSMDLVWNCQPPSRTLADSLSGLDLVTSLILKLLKLSIPLYHHSLKGSKLGLVFPAQCQTDYKLCVEFLNLHGLWLHGREDPPFLLRFCIYQLPLSFVASSQKVSKFIPMLLNLHMLVRNLSCASSLEHSNRSSNAPFARAVYEHPLVEDFAKPIFNIESAVVPKDFSNIASFSKLSIPLENSWNIIFYSIVLPSF